jgi:type I restriction enzyme R subunit
MMTESGIEQGLINKLKDLKYIYRPDIRDWDSLKQNFRQKFEELNKVNLSDSEFTRLLEQVVNADVFHSAKLLRERSTFEREDGTPLNFTLVDINDWCKNTFEVVNQIRINTENSNHRYDVMLLMNGVPVVQIELKRHEIEARRAMQQIVEYKNEPGNGYTWTLLCFIQLFIVSNEKRTWYFANNNSQHFNFNADERFLPLYQLADENNKKIGHLSDFSEQFLAKCTLAQMISRYMVLVETEQMIMMMRPYQIYAVKAIVDCIQQNRGNGYIWHTTGSGKTLTSFKASTLLKSNPDIAKCVFVVDRKDLDRQTREEFNKFQEGCVEENTNTETLVRRLLSDNYADKVIVTTIQKLGLALDGSNKKYKDRLEPLKNKRIAFIFDECHRSQFGENHKAIKEFFPNSQLFGFTGTPIFDKNATYKQVEGEEASYRTTEDVFQKKLHSYTITNAIEDQNVLRFHVDYYKPQGELKPKKGESMTKEAIAKAVLKMHDKATAGRKFNAIFATASINDAIEYYKLFKKMQAEMSAENPDFKPFNIACVFSPPAEGNSPEVNKEIKQMLDDLPQEFQDNKEAPEEKKAMLREIIADYNTQYGTNHSINEFDKYYQDVQKRIKDQKYPVRDYPHSKRIDIIIVVDMLLTGFDSKYLNTLYVDKNLKYHGLIQAFSRTNRILNDSKPYGNVIDFRQQQDAVNEAIAMFSGEKLAEKAREVWLVEPAEAVVEKLKGAVSDLNKFMASQGLSCEPSEVANLKGDDARGQFINLFKDVQRLKTRLDQYTDLNDENIEEIENILPEEQLTGFRGVYLETAQRLREEQKKPEKFYDEVQELDFEYVLFASAMIDYDYIMGLIANFTQTKPEKQKMTRDELIGLIVSDAKFVDEREDITEYINSLEVGKGLSESEIRNGFEAFKKEKFSKQIKEISGKYGVELKALSEFIEKTTERMILDGDALSDLFAPLELGWKERAKAELALMQELIPLLNKLTQGKDISGLSAYEK